MKLKKATSLILFLPILLLFASPAKAANPYHNCGIGAAIFPTNEIAATISNVIWDLGTTALSSATISPETCTNNQAVASRFILETLPHLESDLSTGEGEYMNSLASMLQCGSNSDTVATHLADRYLAFVASPDYLTSSRIQKASVMYNSLQASSDGVCAVIL